MEDRPASNTPRKSHILPVYLSHNRRKKSSRSRGRSLETASMSGHRSNPPADTSKKPSPPPPKATKLKKENDVWAKRLLWLLFFTAFLVCFGCLLSLGVMVHRTHALSNGQFDAPAQLYGHISQVKDIVRQRLARLASQFQHIVDDPSVVQNQFTRRELRSLQEYECIGWRQTSDCTPEGERDEAKDANCSTPISDARSGYCEVRQKTTGEVKRVLHMHCDSIRPGVHFTCDMFQSLMSYSILSTEYEHDSNFTFENQQKKFREFNNVPETPVPVGDDGVKNQSVGQLELSFERGLVFVVYEKVLPGAYVSVRSLRELGCILPIEMWVKPSETPLDHPLLQLLVKEHNVFLREIEDPAATRFYTKLYAVFYSAFDSVLLLDADNFAVKDPTYLFDSPEFISTGAIFWPDFWKPGNTIFNIHENSFVWPFFGITPVDMFEQESGQVMINRRKHLRALNVLMFYGFHIPRLHQDMALVWGDKDLFRFAWMKSESPFHFIQRPPGAAGTKHPDYDLFCGVTMVQHDPTGRVIFLHRNTEKLTHENARKIWTHVQQFKRTVPVSSYRVRGANGGKVFPQFPRCFGKDVHYDKLFTLKPINAFAFEKLEVALLGYEKEVADVMGWAPAVVYEPPMTRRPS